VGSFCAGERKAATVGVARALSATAIEAIWRTDGMECRLNSIK
jgi:hypothetical protein